MMRLRRASVIAMIAVFALLASAATAVAAWRARARQREADDQCASILRSLVSRGRSTARSSTLGHVTDSGSQGPRTARPPS